MPLYRGTWRDHSHNLLHTCTEWFMILTLLQENFLRLFQDMSCEYLSYSQWLSWSCWHLMFKSHLHITALCKWTNSYIVQLDLEDAQRGLLQLQYRFWLDLLFNVWPCREFICMSCSFPDSPPPHTMAFSCGSTDRNLVCWDAGTKSADL